MRVLRTRVFRFLFVAAKVVVLFVAVVVVVLFIAASYFWYSMYQSNLEKGRWARAKTHTEMISAAAENFKCEHGRYPSQAEGVAPLMRYLGKSVAGDPWGRPYVYRFPGQHGPKPDIICYGADGVEGGEGLDADIISGVTTRD